MLADQRNRATRDRAALEITAAELQWRQVSLV
jgi:hypothetical protein